MNMSQILYHSMLLPRNLLSGVGSLFLVKIYVCVLFIMELIRCKHVRIVGFPEKRV